MTTPPYRPNTGPYRPQHTGPHAASLFRPQHPAPQPYPPYVAFAPPVTVTSTPHVLRGDRNGMGTAGLVLGIVSLCFAVIPFVGVVAWAMWPVGVILSGVGLGRSNRALATNRNAALAGLIVSLTAAAVCAAWVVFTVYANATYR